MRTSLFESPRPTVREGYELYNKGQQYNTQINLDETVKTNENFYIGK